jgi:hypothetical protein
MIKFTKHTLSFESPHTLYDIILQLHINIYVKDFRMHDKKISKIK